MNKNIRNFVIIAHIDHGKSTLADRFLELTNTVSENKLVPQYLDGMNLEKEHGITIKMHPVQMQYDEYVLNLIDTPGHVDFTYEVSRALAAVEGAVLLVDGTQGIQAQTLSNLVLAQKQGLKIIGAINKIDVEINDLDKKRKELADLLKADEEEIILLSAKTGKNVDVLLKKIIAEIPSPEIKNESSFKALVFDSHYDDYKGTIAYVRVVEGEIIKGEKIHFAISQARGDVLDLGYFAPQLQSKESLKSGEIGWIATGLKDLNLVRVGDTVVNYNANQKNVEALPGYEEPKPMVFAGFYLAKGKTGAGSGGQDFENFRHSLSQLKLNDSALYFVPESSEALGRGYRLGFLGMLHLQITQERLKEEYGLELVITHPTVPYKVLLKENKTKIVTNPSEWPNPEEIIGYEEPWVKMEIITTPQYLSAIMKLINDSRGTSIHTLTFAERLIIQCEIPLEETIKDFYDSLKSISSGYASLSYEISGYKKTELEKLEVILAGKKFESLSRIIFRDKTEREARSLALKLKTVLPHQNYSVPIQIQAMGRIIARETLPALKKDVTGSLYGGDRTRKMKLWKKQAKGKKKLLAQSDLQIPSEVFFKIFPSSH
ncbi:MAG: translation elongation factor 4 [Candidatus Pacebacteria bacterium]|jgi:GTP-binding protein LepA|nr:translation elongation factor 4 [Candidatus Paceibacterota bacterium]MDD4994560.1 translation elongation factor 4 [Candidatus Paceibacterota bacterium]MDD5535186.1 translation elongation factor 4 [Candidatus Paceibacterota bacterium]